MCLSLIITLPQERQKDADAISEKASTENLKVFKEKRWFRRPSRYLYIASEFESCACDLLTDDADWNAETWDLIKSFLPELSLVFSNLCEQIPEGFLFDALWAGDEPNSRLVVNGTGLSDIIKDNKIKIKITYQVVPVDAKRPAPLN